MKEVRFLSNKLVLLKQAIAAWAILFFCVALFATLSILFFIGGTGKEQSILISFIIVGMLALAAYWSLYKKSFTEYLYDVSAAPIIDNKDDDINTTDEEALASSKREPNRELSRYIRRVMKEKRLKQRDIDRRSGGKITDGYVADLLRGRVSNPSVEKLEALAIGLGVDPSELFAVAYDSAENEKGKQPDSDMTSFLEMMQTVAEDPQLLEILQKVLYLSPDEKVAILESLDAMLSDSKRKSQDRGKKAS